jgi:hypothetical protein
VVGFDLGRLEMGCFGDGAEAPGTCPQILLSTRLGKVVENLKIDNFELV